MPETETIVAIVDDDDGMRRSIRALLEVAGFATRCYESAEAFLADREAIDRSSVLIVDHNLGDISGLELIRIVASHPEHPAILLISAALTPQIADAAIAAGAAWASSKPVPPQDFITFVTSAPRRRDTRM